MLEGGEGIVDSGYGGFVGRDVEVTKRVLDELLVVRQESNLAGI